METILRTLLDPSGFTPHGFCLLWDPGLIWLHAISDGLIGLSYYSIPVALIYFVNKRRDIAFGWIFWLFAGFILACGTTHFLAILTLWQPAYWLDGAVKLVTAVISIAAAIVLWPLIPRALALPSPQILREANESLAQQIAERDRAEVALRVSESRLRQAQKMETIGQLTGGIAHDFNNLLTVILGGLETIGRQASALPQGTEVKRIARSSAMALQAVDNAATLTQRLLAFSRQQPLAPKPLEANRLVAEMSEILRRTLGETISLETVLAGGLWRTLADPNQLENALLNLSVNARDAMPDGGRLTIETANANLDDAYVDQLDDTVSAGQYVLIAISDNGAGMDAQTVERAFEPFFTTKEVGKGTGLGLSQVYGFVRQSKGHVRLYSEPGQGTTVKIYLPRLIAPADAPQQETQAVSQPVSATDGTVLVVEDHDALRAYSTDALRELGYTVLEAAAGQKALEILDSHPDIVLLFTDVVLPDGMNGRQLADEALRRRPGLKVLFTTGYTRNAIIHDGKLDDGVHLLSKPFTYADLAAKLHRIFSED
jgi:signal transduction histidine kinase/ActR/RegA family two-component response regulator